MNKQYLRADDYVQDFNEHAWHDFHGGTINDQDDFYEYFTQWIDNKVTYTFDARTFVIILKLMYLQSTIYMAEQKLVSSWIQRPIRLPNGS